MAEFIKRGGTTNEGVSYEEVTLICTALKLLENKKVKNFSFSSNDKEYGDFDDVVINIDLEGSTETHALQLKHRGKRVVTEDSLKQKNGKLSIINLYASTLTSIQAEKFILYTNSPWTVGHNLKFQLEGEDFYIRVLPVDFQDDYTIFTDDTKFCYRFEIVEDWEGCYDYSPNVLHYKRFFNRFFLYSEQGNVKSLKSKIVEKFKEMFLGDERECQGFSEGISKWMKQKGKKEKLTKEWIQRLIAVQLFLSRIKELSFGNVNQKMLILREAISASTVTVIKEENYDKIKGIWGDAKKEIENKEREVKKLKEKYHLTLDDSQLSSTLLWLMDKSPLIVKEDDVTWKAIELCPGAKFVLLRKESSERKNNVSIFQNLTDLKTKPQIYDKVKENVTCSLQGKEEINLNALAGENDDILELITPDHLLKMISDPYEVGGSAETHPEHYIERSLSKPLISMRYLQRNNQNTMFILDCVSDLPRMKNELTSYDFIDINSPAVENDRRSSWKPARRLERSVIYFSKHECSKRDFEMLRKMNKNNEKCQQFRVRERGKLELIRSTGPLDELEKYRNIKDFFTIDERTLWSSQFENSIHLISSVPGMGKTELMKSFKNNSHSTSWGVILYPSDIYSLYEKLEKSKNHEETFGEFVLNEKHADLKPWDKEILKLMFKQNRMIYIWDGLDEVSRERLETITQIILKYSKTSTHWITSRCHLQKYLEHKLNVFAVSLTQLDEDQQISYIRKRLSKFSSDDIKEIIRKVKSTFVLIEHKEILGIPLQIYLFTELFLRDKEKYLHLLSNTFPLNDLYHYFVEEKFKIYKKRAGLNVQNIHSEQLARNQESEMLKKYEKVALNLLLPDKILKLLNIDNDLDHETIRRVSVGLIVEGNDQILRFFHTSFAEYFAAGFFSKNLEFKNIFEQVLFDSQFINVRFFFDLILANNSSLHISVLYKNIDFLTQFQEDISKCRDNAGRTVLHVAASYGKIHPPLNVQKIKTGYSIKHDSSFNETPESEVYLQMMEYILPKCSISDEDTLFGMTPLKYAQKCCCLVSEIKMLKMMKKEDDIPLLRRLKKEHIIYILYYSAKYGYQEAFEIFMYDLEKYYEERIVFTRLINAKNDQNMNLLYLASKEGHLKIVEYLVACHAHINIFTKQGVTPLFMASENGHKEVVKYLLDSGAKIDLGSVDQRTPLLTASFHGHVEIVNLLFQNDAKINQANVEGYTPLHAACQEGYLNVVKFLVSKGALVNELNKNNVSPLYVAAKEGHEEIVEFLISNQSEINVATVHDVTPLHVAAFHGHLEVVRLLISSNADTNATNKDGATPLWIAVQEKHSEIVGCLLEFDARIDVGLEDGTTPLYLACQNGDFTLVQMLVEQGANVNAGDCEGVTPLLAAFDTEHHDIVDYLKKSGAIIDTRIENDVTPLMTACSEGNERIAKFLLSSGAGVNLVDKEGETSILKAAKQGHVQIVRLLKEAGAEINKQNQTEHTPLYAAAQEGHIEVVRYLVDARADINLSNLDSATPLYIAVQEGHEEIVEFLVSSNYDVNLATNEGATPLHIACFSGKINIVTCLLRSAEIDSVNITGATALYVACEQGHLEIVRLLLGGGSLVNKASDDKSTPLHVACRNGHEDIVKVLIEFKADHTRLDDKGLTPLFVAFLNRHRRIVSFLYRSGASIDITREDGKTPLHVAAAVGDYDFVRYLIHFRCNVNPKDRKGRTPLILASRHQHLQIVKFLITFGAYINVPDRNGHTPLFAACFVGNLQIVKCLIDHDAKINIRDTRDRTPLSVANEKGHSAIASLLVRSGAKVEPLNSLKSNSKRCIVM